MEAKQKAIYLLRKTIITYMSWNDIGWSLEEIKSKSFTYNIPWNRLKEVVLSYIDENTEMFTNLENIEELRYWEQVKEEIKSL